MSASLALPLWSFHGSSVLTASLLKNGFVNQKVRAKASLQCLLVAKARAAPEKNADMWKPKAPGSKNYYGSEGPSRNKGGTKPFKQPKPETAPTQEEMPPDPTWVDLDNGPLVAGKRNSQQVPPLFQNEMIQDKTWAPALQADTRCAIAQAINRQCVPWFIAYECFRDHMKDFCSRHSAWSLRKAKLDEEKQNYLFREVHRMGAALERVCEELAVLQKQVPAISGRVASLEREVMNMRLPPHLQDFSHLPIDEKIKRAQQRARSKSPGGTRLQEQSPAGFCL